jgi:hypothetical protein
VKSLKCCSDSERSHPSSRKVDLKNYIDVNSDYDPLRRVCNHQGHTRIGPVDAYNLVVCVHRCRLANRALSFSRGSKPSCIDTCKMCPRQESARAGSNHSLLITNLLQRRRALIIK